MGNVAVALNCDELNAFEQRRPVNGSCKYPWYSTAVGKAFFVAGVEALTPPTGVKAKNQRWETFTSTDANGVKGKVAKRLA
jgi:hypothetical protein|tara:strand:- start:839 stop:1081 length:243 start_codon:yes stop_codon:yes gene_type:complete